MVANKSDKAFLNQFDKDIVFVRDFHAVSEKELAGYQVLILDYSEPDDCLKFLKKVRSSPYEDIYLIPAFILSEVKPDDPFINDLIDGIVPTLSIEQHLRLIETILDKKDGFTAIESTFIGNKNLLKLLRYMVTRDKRLQPIGTPKSHMGYTYPFLEVNLEIENNKKESTKAIFEIFQMAEQDDFLKPTFVDKVHLCDNCLSGFINYRETCENCGSRDINIEDTIHHFICGYVGPERDFFVEDDLICPKCDRTLHHIGVDYDKPSVVVTCNNCGNITQEPVIATYCYSCTKEGQLDQLDERIINAYDLTPVGVNAASSGIARKSSESATIPGYITFNTFRTFLRYEVERTRLSSRESSITSLSIVIPTTALNSVKGERTKLIREIADFVRKNVLPADIITLINPDTFLIISPDSSIESTSERISNIRGSIDTLLKNNLKSESHEIIVDLLKIGPDDDHEEILDQLLSKVN